MRYLMKGLCLLMLLSLTACSWITGKPHADLTFKSAQYLNPDIDGRPSPVVIAIYQLKSAYTFQQADAASLMTDSAKILGNDLIDKNIVEIRPNSTETIKQSVDPDTQYLGIVAEYRSATSESWHKVIKLKSSDGKKADITVHLGAEGFTVTTN